MLIVLWFKGLFQVGRGRLVGAILGVALCVALLALLGAFIVSSGATMTARAITDVPVDWQVQLNTGVDAAAARTVLGQVTTYTALQTVDYATVSSLTTTSGATTQTTGAGKVLGIDTQYPAIFPGEIRLLTGTLNGVLIAQQTAANLHVGVGDRVAIGRLGFPSASVTVGGVVDLPNADSLFQAVGVLPSAAPQAPPDNVLLLPAAQWHLLFDPQGSGRPDSVQTQLHVRIAHDLPADPAAAYIQVQQQARNFEAQDRGERQCE